MNPPPVSKFLMTFILCVFFAPILPADGETAAGRDPKQPVDEAYTAKMKKYTTEPFFTSPLVNYLPASKNVPTPQAVLGDVAGAPREFDTHQRRATLQKRNDGHADHVIEMAFFFGGLAHFGRDRTQQAVAQEDSQECAHQRRGHFVTDFLRRTAQRAHGDHNS